MPPPDDDVRRRATRWHCRLLAAAAAVALLAGCHKGGGGSPVVPSTSVVSVALAATSDYLRAGETLTLTLTATLSDGSSRTVQGTWGTDAPTVATVSTGGQVTAVAVGDVTVFADYQGRRATRLFHVVPDFSGIWSGGYRVVGCTDSGDWAGTCDDEDATIRWRLALDFTQDRTLVQGDVLAFEDFPIPVEGSIGGDGRLTVSGAGTQADDLGDYTLAISDWRTYVGTDEMTGTFVVTGTHSALAGEYRLSLEIDSVFRDRAQPAGVRPARAIPSRPSVDPHRPR